MSTPAERAETPAEWAERTAKEQGKPAKVDDPSALRKVAVIIGKGD